MTSDSYWRSSFDDIQFILEEFPKDPLKVHLKCFERSKGICLMCSEREGKVPMNSSRKN
jgi:hypothetical protein